MHAAPAGNLHQRFWHSQPINGAYSTTELPEDVDRKWLEHPDIQAVAKFGEKLIARSAESAGWKVIRQSLRRPGFELDIVTQYGSLFRIVEVKTRRNPNLAPDFYLVSQWVNRKKISALQRGAIYLLHEFARQKIPVTSISCDLVAVDLKSTGPVMAYRWPNICEFHY